MIRNFTLYTFYISTGIFFISISFKIFFDIRYKKLLKEKDAIIKKQNNIAAQTDHFEKIFGEDLTKRNKN